MKVCCATIATVSLYFVDTSWYRTTSLSRILHQPLRHPLASHLRSGDLNIVEFNLGGSGMMGGSWIMMGVPPTPMETMPQNDVIESDFFYPCDHANFFRKRIKLTNIKCPKSYQFGVIQHFSAGGGGAYLKLWNGLLKTKISNRDRLAITEKCQLIIQRGGIRERNFIDSFLMLL